MLILMRVAPILFLMPLLGARNMCPSWLKIGLALAVSLILLPLSVKMEIRAVPSEPFCFGWFLRAELFIGFILGLAVKVIFAGIQMAGEFVGFRWDFRMASLIDPQSGVNSAVTAQFNYLVALLILPGRGRAPLVF